MATISDLATVMGSMADRLSDDLKTAAEGIGANPTQAQIAGIQGKSAVFATALQTMTNVIKTVSDADASIARNVKA